MNRLKCAGKPLLTSIQFYRDAALPDLLRQREAFLSFSGSHLNLEGRNQYIFMLQEISRKPALLQDGRWKEELQKSLCDEPRLIDELDSVWQDVNCYFSETSFPASVKKEAFLAFAALSILISRFSPEDWKKNSPEELVDAYQGKTNPEETGSTIQFGQARNLALPPLKKPYIVSYDPDYPMRQGQKIETYGIEASSIGTYDCVILDLGGEKQCKIMRGERLLVNVVEDTIVAILPNKIISGGTSLERRTDGSIYINHRRCPHTQKVTSFAVQEKTGLYCWADDGKLDGSYLDKHPNCGKYTQRIVEVALSENFYYLLSADGMLDSNDPVREQVDRPLAALKALRKFSR